MFIPIGLIARAVSAAQDRELELSMEAAGAQHAMDQQRARYHELATASSGPDACLLALTGNDWSTCYVDGVAVGGATTAAASAGGYRDPADPFGAPPHGFVGVSAGRHAVSVSLQGRLVATTIALHPREAMFLRLDREAGVWSRHEDAHGHEMLARYGRGELVLMNYLSTVVMPLVRAGSGKTAQEAMNECTPFLRALLAAVKTGDQARAVAVARQAGNVLVGAALASFEPITSFIGFHAFELVGAGKPKEAWLLLQAGLSILPENPTLLATLGEIQIGAGGVEEGRENLRRALAREAGLDSRLRDRVHQLMSQ